jgi:LmbE family N-acetylglucosaminyl deacetylase
MDTVALLEIVQNVEESIKKCRPDIVYTHHAGDVNIDHRQVHDAVVAACRPQPGCPVRQLLFFETPSSSEWRPPASMTAFSPNWFIDVSEYMDKKLAALSAYADELRPFPHPRSIQAVEHLARWRGATVGVAAAEAFELGWKIT